MPNFPKSRKSKYHAQRKPFDGVKKKNKKFYNSEAWKQTRFMALQRDNFNCVMCWEKGWMVAAEVVDHIVPINDGGARLSMSNLQSLCHRCHNAKSGKEGNERRKR